MDTPDTPTSYRASKGRPSTDDDVDEDLMRAIAAHGAPAEQIERCVEELVRRHTKMIWRYFARRGIRPEEADDLVQEVFLRLVRERAKYGPGKPFLPWFFTIARNVMVSQGRRRKAEKKALSHYAEENRSQPAAGSHEAGDPVQRSEEHERVRRALADLPENDREVLRLARFEGLNYKQIAEIFGASPGAVKVRAFRALEKLRAALKIRAPLSGEVGS